MLLANSNVLDFKKVYMLSIGDYETTGLLFDLKIFNT